MFFNLIFVRQWLLANSTLCVLQPYFCETVATHKLNSMCSSTLFLRASGYSQTQLYVFFNLIFVRQWLLTNSTLCVLQPYFCEPVATRKLNSYVFFKLIFASQWLLANSTLCVLQPYFCEPVATCKLNSMCSSTLFL